MKIRLNKYLSEVGHCSRRNADRLIKAGKVTVNNIIAELGTKVVDDDQIVMFKNSTIFSEHLAILEKGRLCLILKCNEQWCKIKTEIYTLEV